MGQVSDYIEAPYQGVSQAAPQVRLKQQAQVLLNTLVVVPDGAKKRPPITWIKKIASANAADFPLFHLIDLEGVADRLLLVNRQSSNNVPRMFNADTGVEETVTVDSAAQTYLTANTSNPLLDHRAITVADTTFLTNAKRSVANGTAKSPARNREGLFWVRQAAYGRRYRVTITKSGGSPIVAEYLTPDGSTAASTRYTDTDVIVSSLYNGSVGPTVDNGEIVSTLATGLTADGFTAELIGAVLYVSHPTTNFSIVVEDGQGGTAMVAVKDDVQRFSDLPLKAKDGMVVRIVQDSSTDKDDFFVTFRISAGTGTGVWEETIGPDVNLGVNPATMPMVLTQTGSNTWAVDVGDWAPREVGDTNLNPDPSFVGAGIRDVAFWHGRLVILGRDTVSLSDSLDPYKFYVTSLSTGLDTDTFELASPHAEGIFQSALPFEDKLLVHADVGFFDVVSEGITNVNTTKIDEFTLVDTSTLVKPFSVLNYCYFVAPRGDTASAIYEMNTDKVTDNVEADDTTLNVPSYVPTGINLRCVCKTEYLGVYGVHGATTFNVHVFRRSKDDKGLGSERLQNAHQTWSLTSGFTLAGLAAKNTKIYILARKGNDFHLGFIDVKPAQFDDGNNASILSLIDWRVKNTALAAPTYNSVQNQTSFVLPYTPADDDDVTVTVRAPGGTGGFQPVGGTLPNAYEGQVVPIDHVSGDTVVLDGDWRTCALWFGVKYPWRWQLSRLYARDPNSRVIRTGRLTLGTILIDLATTAYLKVKVLIRGRQARNYEFEGYIYDDPDSQYNAVGLSNTTFEVPVRGNSEKTEITLENDTHLPTYALGVTWFGELNEKARRLS